MNFVIRNEVDTLDEIFRGKSIARYGDGEISLISDPNYKGINFQQTNSTLIEKLKACLLEDNCNLIIGLPPFLCPQVDASPNVAKLPKDNVVRSLKGTNIEATYMQTTIGYWDKYIQKKCCRDFIGTFIREDRVYYSSFITRISELRRSSIKIIVNKFNDIIKNRKIILLCNEATRQNTKILNIVFRDAAEVVIIIIPSLNAYSIYNQIMDTVLRYDVDYLIFGSIGPTATIMANEISKLGYQFIDFGHYIPLYPTKITKQSSPSQINIRTVINLCVDTPIVNTV